MADTSPLVAGFLDRLGDRVRVTDRGAEVEVLRLRPELTAGPVFEAAVRRRTEQLARLQHPNIARVLQVARLAPPDGRLVVVSEAVDGLRLSEVLEAADHLRLPMHSNAVVFLLRQLLGGVASLHEVGPGISHGALGTERLLVTPDCRLVVTESVFGGALRFLPAPSPDRLWRELRLALANGEAQLFGRLTDLRQIGVIALSLALGRQLRRDEPPSRLGSVLNELGYHRAQRGADPFGPELDGWLARVLSLSGEETPWSVAEAQRELSRIVQGNAGLAFEPRDLGSLLQKVAEYYAADGEVPRVEQPSSPPEASTAGSGAGEPVEVSGPPDPGGAGPGAGDIVGLRSSEPVEASSSPEPGGGPVEPPTSSIPEVEPQAPESAPEPAPPAEVTPPTASACPAPTSPRAAVLAVSKPREETTAPARLVPPPALAVAEPREQTTPPGRMVLPPPNRDVPRLSDTTGRLRFDTKRPDASFADAVSPLAEAFAPASVSAPFSSEPERPRRDAQRAPSRAPSRPMFGVDLSEEPSEPARRPAKRRLGILIGLGVAAVVIIAAGGYPLLRPKAVGATATSGVQPTSAASAPETPAVSTSGPSGAPAAVAAPTPTAPAAAPASPAPPLAEAPSGLVEVVSALALDVSEGGGSLGRSGQPIRLPVGRHTLDLAREDLGYRASHVVEVRDGRREQIRPSLPSGDANLNATPWAEVWVDGRSLGETPLGNLKLTIGPHEVKFRHPELGEQTRTLTVTTGAVARLSVDLRK